MKKFLALIIVLLILPLTSAAGGGSGGSSGGGSGSSGGGSGSTLEFTSSKNTTDKILQTGGYYTLKLKDKSSYDFFIKSQDVQQIILVISEPFQEIAIPLSSSAEIDLNKDGTADVLVEVKSAIVPGKSTQLEIKDSFERKPKEEKQQPPAAQPLAGLLCGDKPSRRERVQCRLDLEEEEFEYEYNLRFLPEECIPLESKQKARCINIYQSVQQCWKFKEDAARVNCVKNQIKFKNIREEIQKCVLLQPEERSTCIENVKENVYTIIKFKFYNLEEKAEELLEEGKAPQDDVAAFITEIEGRKIEFNLAGSIAEKRQIIQQVNKLWKEFLKTTLQS